MLLPVEIIFLICQHNRLADLIHYMLLSKRCNAYFNSHESVRILKVLHQKNPQGSRMRGQPGMAFLNHAHDDTAVLEHIASLTLPDWIVEPVLMTGALSDRIIESVKSKGYHLVVKGEHFITGGAIAQIALGMSWDSDVDIFIAAKHESRNKMVVGGVEYDIILKQLGQSETTFGRPEHILRRFDIGICQVGVLVGANKELLVYVTPLFLHSRGDVYTSVGNLLSIRGGYPWHALFEWTASGGHVFQAHSLWP